jgi:hypothetical protein
MHSMSRSVASAVASPTILHDDMQPVRNAADPKKLAGCARCW